MGWWDCGVVDGDGLRYCGLFWSAVMDKRQYFD